MAARTKTIKVQKKDVKKTSISTRPAAVKNSSNNTQNKNALSNIFSFGDSYASLVLGIIVVIVVAILLISFVRGRNAADDNNQETSSVSTEDGNTYTVKAGDDLWSIAVAEYNDGFKWTEIAKANNINNPSDIKEGVKLTIPELDETTEKVAVTSIAPTTAVTPTTVPTISETKMTTPSTTQPVVSKITTDKYVVQQGDDLWDISVRAYNDGYKWTEIAKANKLVNPNIIHKGNNLVIPR